MSIIQKFMNKYFGWKYAMFYTALGNIEIARYFELQNGTKYVVQFFKREMLEDGTISGVPIINGAYN